MRGERDARVLPQRRHLLEGGDRVLVVADVVGLDLAQHPARRRQRPLHVGIELDLRLLAQRLAQHPDGADLQLPDRP